MIIRLIEDIRQDLANPPELAKRPILSTIVAGLVLLSVVIVGCVEIV